MAYIKKYDDFINENSDSEFLTNDYNDRLCPKTETELVTIAHTVFHDYFYSKNDNLKLPQYVFDLSQITDAGDLLDEVLSCRKNTDMTSVVFDADDVEYLYFLGLNEEDIENDIFTCSDSDELQNNLYCIDTNVSLNCKSEDTLVEMNLYTTYGIDVIGKYEPATYELPEEFPDVNIRDLKTECRTISLNDVDMNKRYFKKFQINDVMDKFIERLGNDVPSITCEEIESSIYNDHYNMLRNY